MTLRKCLVQERNRVGRSGSIPYAVWLKKVGAEPFQRENIPLISGTSWLSKNYGTSSLPSLPCRPALSLSNPMPSSATTCPAATHISSARDLGPDPHPTGTRPRHHLDSARTTPVCHSTAKVMKQLLRRCHGSLLLVGASPPPQRHSSSSSQRRKRRRLGTCQCAWARKAGLSSKSTGTHTWRAAHPLPYRRASMPHAPLPFIPSSQSLFIPLNRLHTTFSMNCLARSNELLNTNKNVLCRPISRPELGFVKRVKTAWYD
jgi:hypothetical protein